METKEQLDLCRVFFSSRHSRYGPYYGRTGKKELPVQLVKTDFLETDFRFPSTKAAGPPC